MAASHISSTVLLIRINVLSNDDKAFASLSTSSTFLSFFSHDKCYFRCSFITSFLFNSIYIFCIMFFRAVFLIFVLRLLMRNNFKWKKASSCKTYIYWCLRCSIDGLSIIIMIVRVNMRLSLIKWWSKYLKAKNMSQICYWWFNSKASQPNAWHFSCTDQVKWKQTLVKRLYKYVFFFIFFLFSDIFNAVAFFYTKKTSLQL